MATANDGRKNNTGTKGTGTRSTGTRGSANQGRKPSTRSTYLNTPVGGRENNSGTKGKGTRSRTGTRGRTNSNSSFASKVNKILGIVKNFVTDHEKSRIKKVRHYTNKIVGLGNQLHELNEKLRKGGLSSRKKASTAKKIIATNERLSRNQDKFQAAEEASVRKAPQNSKTTTTQMNKLMNRIAEEFNQGSQDMELPVNVREDANKTANSINNQLDDAKKRLAEKSLRNPTASLSKNKRSMASLSKNGPAKPIAAPSLPEVSNQGPRRAAPPPPPSFAGGNGRPRTSTSNQKLTPEGLREVAQNILKGVEISPSDQNGGNIKPATTKKGRER